MATICYTWQALLNIALLMCVACPQNQLISETAQLRCFPLNLWRRPRRGTKTGQRLDRLKRLWGIDQCANKLSMINANRIHASKSCICTLNPWSVCNKTTKIHDFFIDQQLNLFALTENWLTGTDMDNVIITSLLSNGWRTITR